MAAKMVSPESLHVRLALAARPVDEAQRYVSRLQAWVEIQQGRYDLGEIDRESLAMVQEELEAAEKMLETLREGATQ
jgi:hypothetical protein